MADGLWGGGKAETTGSRDHCITLLAGVRGQYTGYDAPDDNAYIERVFRTIKEEEIWPNLYDTLGEARAAIAAYVDYYNNERIHSALNYKTPSEIAATFITRAAA